MAINVASETSTFPPADVDKELHPGHNKKIEVDSVSSDIATSKHLKGMDTSKPAIFVNGGLLPMHVRKRVRTVVQVIGSDRGAVIGKSTDDQQLSVKGAPPSVPLTNFVEVIGIADSEKSIQAEIWTNFGDTFVFIQNDIHAYKFVAWTCMETLLCCLASLFSYTHKMPRTRGSAEAADKPDEPENPVESEEGVDLDGDNEQEEAMEEEVEYEEVEEEEEVEEIEEEEEVEEEVEEEEEIEEGVNEADAQKGSESEEEEDEEKKHAELLALPPHGSEVYLGGIPHNATKNLRGFCESIGEVTEVRIMKGKDSGEAKGPTELQPKSWICFIEYYNHACAEYSRKKMSDAKFTLDGQGSVCEELTKRHFSGSPKTAVERHGKVIKVFFSGDRPSFGLLLAKPQADQKSSAGTNLQKSVLHPTFPPRLGYGLVGGTYGALGAGYQVIYGRGPTPAGMAMMPMLLPDGRIGYVLQQPGMQPHTPPPQPRAGRGGGAGSSSGGRRGNDSNRGRSRYNPY
ncbi:hypothetical protein GH714_038244 [Hevea brasiliensis]|uniref:RRM domain-containing protein n=1 Tax=Hevea brasiliensis TaxID=3981 RepID=A0A6A6L626_HEVBR|nr:hypothetical protein GH714_038244 [Hevea brasiliensis]